MGSGPMIASALQAEAEEYAERTVPQRPDESIRAPKAFGAGDKVSTTR